ncbi:group XIIB secretory phospholipase A2-like protein [Synchiropus splendidus]|uniref:group XIIB secretory phospholipase A2-like protein n=1 Tax=Synchiropus splendidus TaxID=270530 RepID=UPI00237E3B8F|nr:group XIIB secretory phospholipase A2-like protein [Synchiropus splendidus]
MLLQTLLLLILSLSSSWCATLGHYQAGATEEASDVDLQVTESVPAENSLSDLLARVDTDETAKPVDAAQEPSTSETSPEENEILPVLQNSTSLPQETSAWSIHSIRSSFQTVHGYFDSLVELVGGHNGVCRYNCRYGDPPQPRPGYLHQEPNGCSSSLVGLQLDPGIPAMTRCCNLLDVCYDTCGNNKYHCDSKFRSCLQDLCSDLKTSLGFMSNVQACESMADALYNTVWTLGCRPYMNSQRAACVCVGEMKDEL